MGEIEKKRKIVIGVLGFLLVMMVMAAGLAIVLSIKEEETSEINTTSTRQKAIQDMCQAADYKETCISSLSSVDGDSNDPLQLTKSAFRSTIKFIKEAVNKSNTWQAAEKDPRAKDALQSCKELIISAGDDLQRTLYKYQQFDLSEIHRFLTDLRIWLSAAITYQGTCLDGFKGVPGDSGSKMTRALNSSLQMTSNSLAIVTDIAATIQSFNAQSNNRRLLSDDEIHGDGGGGYRHWVLEERRSLFEGNSSKIIPDVVVAKDGSGKYKTINEALEDIKRNDKNIQRKGNQTFVLYIKEGIYEEKVKFNMTHLTVIGDGPTKTKITAKSSIKDGISTLHTPTVDVTGDFFIAKDIGFENTAGPDNDEAVALRVGSDRSIFYNCQIDGYHGTLFTHAYRQFYRDCVISGSTDFIFGDSAAVFQNCKILVRKPAKNQQQCVIVAHGRGKKQQPTGVILQNCTIAPDSSYEPKWKTFLGRPLKAFSRTVVMESFLDELIDPKGWFQSNEEFAPQTVYYAEFNNRGPGSSKSQRVKWPGIRELSSSNILHYTADHFFHGQSWIKPTNLPYSPSLMYRPTSDDNAPSSAPAAQQHADSSSQDLGRDYSTPRSYAFAPTPGQESSEFGEYDAASAPSPVGSNKAEEETERGAEYISVLQDMYKNLRPVLEKEEGKEEDEEYID